MGLSVAGRGMVDVEGFALEEVARWMIGHGYATGHGDSLGDLLAELEWQAMERGVRSAAATKEKGPDRSRPSVKGFGGGLE